jgi:putative PIN family toxin of toxin-antitoxin system
VKRIVADTNILVSAILKPKGIFSRHLRRGSFLLLVSDSLLKELADVLRRPQLRSKYNLTPEYIHAYLQLLRSRSEHIIVTETIHACRDEDDNKFLEIAVSGNADFLVTYDSDLLVLHPIRGIPILAPGEIWSKRE